MKFKMGYVSHATPHMHHIIIGREFEHLITGNSFPLFFILNKNFNEKKKCNGLSFIEFEMCDHLKIAYLHNYVYQKI